MRYVTPVDREPALFWVRLGADWLGGRWPLFKELYYTAMMKEIILLLCSRLLLLCLYCWTRCMVLFLLWQRPTTYK